ncbi:hypothetical protein V6C27_13915, partial [Peptococcaceae bacterium 1198_IL3148]
MWKIIKYLLVAVMFVSIITPLNNAHLLKAEAASTLYYYKTRDDVSWQSTTDPNTVPTVLCGGAD